MNNDMLCGYCKRFNSKKKYCEAFEEKITPKNTATRDCSEFEDIRVQYIK